MTYAILNDYNFTVIEVVRETDKTVFYKCYNYAGTDWVERRASSAFAWRGDEEEARHKSDLLKLAKFKLTDAKMVAQKEYRASVASIVGTGEVR